MRQTARKVDRLVLLLVVFSLLLAVFAAGCEVEEEELIDETVIKIGVAGPMGYIQGDHHWFGASLAADEINEAGGVQVGDEVHTVELVEVDTNEIFSVDEAVTAVERAITVDEVDFMMGGFRTEAVDPYTEIAADYERIFFICGAATNELLEGRVDVDYERWKYLFRITPLKSTTLAQISFLQLFDVAMQIREELGIEAPRVAILAERLEWNEAMVQIAEGFIEQPIEEGGLGAEFVGTWRPSATADSVTSELEAIRGEDAHIIFTINSGPIGVPYGRDYGRMEIPAASVGITVEGQASGYLDATDGYGEYVGTINTYGEVEITEHTLEFMEKFMEKTGEVPIYTAGTYDALYILVDAIERAGTTDTDAVIEELEATEHEGAVGTLVFDELHDVVFGPGYVTGLGTQWVDGEQHVFWPYEWQPDPVDQPDLEVTYPGTGPFNFPPWFMEYWQDQ